MVCKTRWAAVGLILCLSAPLAAAAEYPWDNPFGVCNPWWGIDEIGLAWCRCGGGSTALGDWGRIQPKSADHFNWADADNELEGWHRKLKLTPVPILCYTAQWASSGKNHLYPPRDVFDYFRFVRAMAEHYKGQIPAYEVWNEPNGRGVFFAGGVDKMVELIKAHYCAVKQVDPNIQVIYPGLAGVDPEYVERSFELGAGDYYDIMAAHPYQWGRTFNESWQAAESLAELRALIDRHGDEAKPIWLNEFGWEHEGADKARLLAIAMTFFHSLEHLGIERMIWFSAKSWSDRHGLFDKDGKKTIAVDAYRVVVEQLLGRHFIGRIPVEGARAFVFAEPDIEQPVTIAVWSPTLEPIAVRLPLATSEPIAVHEIDGSKHEVTAESDMLAIDATPAPRYLTVSRTALVKLEPAPPIRPRPGKPIPANEQRFVCAQLVVPDHTHRAHVTRSPSDLTVSVYNFTDQPQAGHVVLTSPILAQPASQSYELAAESSTMLTFKVDVRDDVDPGIHPVRITGAANDKLLGVHTDSIRVCRGRAIEFLGNSWVESHYLRQSPAGAPSVSFGGQWVYEFDLTGCTEARISAVLGAYQGNPWNLEASSDNEDYEVLLSGKTARDWQHIDVPDKYLGGKIFLRIRGKDCQLSYFVLDTVP